jgi:hypothetical protein
VSVSFCPGTVTNRPPSFNAKRGLLHLAHLVVADTQPETCSEAPSVMEVFVEVANVSDLGLIVDWQVCSVVTDTLFVSSIVSSSEWMRSTPPSSCCWLGRVSEVLGGESTPENDDCVKVSEKSEIRSGINEGDGDSVSDARTGILGVELVLKDREERDGRREVTGIAGDDSDSVLVEEAGESIEYLRNLFFISSTASVVGAGLFEVRRGLPNVEDETLSIRSLNSRLFRRSSLRLVFGLLLKRPDWVCGGLVGLARY